MAEGLFNHLTAKRPKEFAARSAGISAIDGFPATPETIHVMREEEGIDVSSHQGKRLRAEMIQEADKIFVMEQFQKDWILSAMPEAEGKVFLMTEFGASDDDAERGMDVPDPIRMSPSFYKNVLSAIRRSVERIIKNL